jgi:tetratricopeptide (TPR) repeat protein
LSQLARALFFTDQNRRSIEVADRVLEVAEHADLPAIVADTLISKGTALGSLGRVIEGVALIAAGRDLAEARGFGSTVLRAQNNLAYIESLRDPRSALESSRAGLALTRRLGIRGWMASFIANLGEFGMRTGDWDDGLTEIEAALTETWEGFDRVGLLASAVGIWGLRGEPVEQGMAELSRLAAASDDPQMRSGSALTAGVIAFAGGDLRHVREECDRAAAMVVGLVPIARARSARAALWMGDVGGAIEDLAAFDASGFDGSALEADRATIRAGIAATEGRASEALAGYREALQAWRDLGLAWDEALCGLDMAQLLDLSEPEVRAAADRARETFVRLRATPFVSRLDEALGRPASSSGRSAPATIAARQEAAQPTS